MAGCCIAACQCVWSDIIITCHCILIGKPTFQLSPHKCLIPKMNLCANMNWTLLRNKNKIKRTDRPTSPLQANGLAAAAAAAVIIEQSFIRRTSAAWNASKRFINAMELINIYERFDRIGRAAVKLHSTPQLCDPSVRFIVQFVVQHKLSIYHCCDSNDLSGP